MAGFGCPPRIALPASGDYAGVVELEYTAVLKTAAPDRDCGFKSHHPHSLYAFARSATGLGFSLRRKLAEVLASALRGDAAALVPHDRSSGPAALLQQI